MAIAARVIVLDQWRPGALLEPIGHIPPAEFEATYWSKQTPDSINRLKQPSLR
jgi:hypothetical protein